MRLHYWCCCLLPLWAGCGRPPHADLPAESAQASAADPLPPAATDGPAKQPAPGGEKFPAAAAGTNAAGDAGIAAAPSIIADVHAPSVPQPPAIDESSHAYEDVRLDVEADELVFGNSQVELRFSRRDGGWTSLKRKGFAENCIAAGKPATALDFRIDQQWMVETHGAKLKGHRWAVDEATGQATLRLAYGVLARDPPLFIPRRFSDRAVRPIAAYAPSDPYEYELTAIYRLAPGSAHVERSAELQRKLSKNFFHSSFRELDGFLFVLPGAAAGNPRACTVEVPGPLFTYTYIDPGTPYERLAGTFVDCKTSPDRLPGIVGLENRGQGLALSTWLDTQGEVAYQTFLSGDGERISVLLHSLRSERLADQALVRSDVQHIALTDTFRQAQRAQREMSMKSLPLGATTPAWAREMVILEIGPGLQPGGFKAVAAELPRYAQMGINTVYLLPHWLGSYSNFDPLTVDPQYGTPDDLKELVATAHGLGLRFLFDMVVHGFHPDSPLVSEHPEFFTRNEQGLLETHFNWGSINTDPRSEAYLDYMERLVLHDLETYDIDGYRIDAASFKSPNWDVQNRHKAWESSSTVPLFRRMYAAMQRVKPDVVFYAEMFGPAMHTVSNLAQDANWAVVTDVFGQFDRGQIDAAAYKAGMAQSLDSMQPGVNRIRFCRNHDTSWFFPDHYHGFTPRFLALDAVHILFGVPVIFAGDQKYPPSLRDVPEAIEHYTRVIGLRRQFPEFARGDVLLREVAGEERGVFSGLRRDGDNVGLALVSLDGAPHDVALQLVADTAAGTDLAAEGFALSGTELVDPADGSTVTMAAAGGAVEGRARVTIKPFQVLVGRLVRRGESR